MRVHIYGDAARAGRSGSTVLPRSFLSRLSRSLVVASVVAQSKVYAASDWTMSPARGGGRYD